MADAVGPILIAAFALALVIVLWRRGRRADRSRDHAPSQVPIEEQSSIDLWRDISEGRDPTDDRPE